MAFREDFKKRVYDVQSPCHLRKVAKFHIDSYNYMIREGLSNACLDISPVFTKTNPYIKISVSSAAVAPLQYPMNLRKHKKIVYPSEARIRGSTYFAELHLQLLFEMGGEKEYTERVFYIPLMLKSDLCYLNGMTDQQLVECKEDANDPGGYFIVKGQERLIRLFLIARQNYPFALRKNSFKALKSNYTEYGIYIRSVKGFHSQSDVYLHYLNGDCIEIRLFHRKYPRYVPLMLLMKALINKSDYCIVQEIMKFNPDDVQMRKKVIDMLRLVNASDEPVVRLHQQAKNFIGAMFCPVLGLPSDTTNDEAADFLFRKCLLIHLETNQEKFNFLCFAVSKLFHLVHTKCKEENINNPVFQEILSPCQIYMIPIKAGVTMFLHSVKNNLTRLIQKNSFGRALLNTCTSRAASLTPMVSSMIATGNFLGRNWGLMSDTGYTVQVKRRNIFDTIAQFTGLYQFSMEHYSADMRKFYPESWGFICPVQTPEGENSGLYNQLATGSEVVSFSSKRLQATSLFNMGIIPFCDPILGTKLPRYVVYIDGIILGFVEATYAEKFVSCLRHKRSNRDNMLPLRTEIVFIEKEQPQFLFPCIYIFTSPCRMIRKIKNRISAKKEYIGTFEQMFMNIAIQDKQNSVYVERNCTNIFSIAAGLIPFSEYNPGTRNIFSSVKCRQGISIACHNSSVRGDRRYNQMMYPQSPVISTVMYSDYNFEDYPIGTNVIIAVLSYTGFDMEDAIVLNKASLERGLFTDIDWKTVYYDFNELEKELEYKLTNVEEVCSSKTKTEIEFKRNPADPHVEHLLDNDGLPYIGRIVKNGEVVLSVHSTKTGTWVYKKYEGKKAACVESVKFMGVSPASLADGRKLPVESKKVAITYCMKRVPEVGDKFSNRHGQKGICGTLLPSDDLPFSASGIVPDIIFNPHSIPSRMTIGMLLEIMAAKAALLKGEKYDVEPFKYSSEHMSAADICGKKLKEVGYDFYGEETFYSGTSGEELEASVFCGSAYYLKLCHIVDEKYQVSSVGEVDPKTQQPVNLGKSGAVRFGEMERDAILSHGAIKLTMDRLLHNSDKYTAYICLGCHTMLYPVLQHMEVDTLQENKTCDMCNKSEVHKLCIPYVLVYLIPELLVMGHKSRILY